MQHLATGNLFNLIIAYYQKVNADDNVDDVVECIH